MIIILNGASSSGKSTIAEALNILSPKPFLHLGIDLLYKIMPASYINQGRLANKGFLLTNTDAGATVKFGAYGQQVRDCSAEMAKVFTDAGLNILIDEVLLGDRFLKAYVAHFKEAQAYLIGINCSLKTLQERELLRGNRAIGLAASQFRQVHKPNRFYDLELDSETSSPFENAKKILAFIANSPKPQGLKLCAKRMGMTAKASS